jgi:hypothetical protein
MMKNRVILLGLLLVLLVLAGVVWLGPRSAAQDIEPWTKPKFTATATGTLLPTATATKTPTPTATPTATATATATTVPVTGTAYYFDATGGSDSGAGTIASPFQTITKANAVLTANTTGYFKSGETWTGSLQPAASNITYTAWVAGPGRPIINGGAAPAVNAAGGRNYIHIDGLELQANDGQWNLLQNGWISGADGEGCHYWHVANVTSHGPFNIFGHDNLIELCDIDGTINDGPPGEGDAWGNGVIESYPASHNNTYRYNTIWDFTNRCIWSMNRTHSTTVYSNELYNSLNGVDFDAAGSGQYGQIAAGNYVHDFGFTGIGFESCFNCKATENHIVGIGITNVASIGIGSILYDSGESCGPTGTEFTDHYWADINLLVANNIIHKPGWGVSNYYGSGVKIFGNSIGSTVMAGLYLPEWSAAITKNEVIGNLFWQCGSDSIYYGAMQLGVPAFNSSIFTQEHHNSYWPVVGGAAYLFGMTGPPWTSMSLAEWKAATGQGVGDIGTDPTVTNGAAGDYTLLAGSPAIDAGVVMTDVIDDFNGVWRSTTPNIGALE